MDARRTWALCRSGAKEEKLPIGTQQGFTTVAQGGCIFSGPPVIVQL